MTSRPLTVEEAALARTMFGGAIAYDQVRVHNRKWWPFQPRAVTMAPDGDLWFHPEGGLFCDDFCASPLNLQGLFIHEMTHVWQHQQGIYLPLARHPFCRYDYSLKPGWSLKRYGIPQDRITWKYYDAGHMMYIRDEDRAKLSADIRAFIRAR